LAHVDIGPGALLAPMEAVTDLPFRTVCEEHGAALTYTEFLSAQALTRGAVKATSRMWASLGGRRFAVQVFGREPEVLAQAARMAADIGASIVDINMGCPARKVTAGMCGSALMREPDLAARIVAAVRAALPASIPVTVKHRAGWDDLSQNAGQFARRMVDAGAALITVHGRTRAQGFRAGFAGPIAEARAALPRRIPVVGNGDVRFGGRLPGHEARNWLRRRDDRPGGTRQSRGCSATSAPSRKVSPFPRHPASERRGCGAGTPISSPSTPCPRWCLHELRKTLAWYSRGLHMAARICATAVSPKASRKRCSTWAKPFS
jgi:hypothetical protein